MKVGECTVAGPTSKQAPRNAVSLEGPVRLPGVDVRECRGERPTNSGAKQSSGRSAVLIFFASFSLQLASRSAPVLVGADLGLPFQMHWQVDTLNIRQLHEPASRLAPSQHPSSGLACLASPSRLPCLLL